MKPCTNALPQPMELAHPPAAGDMAEVGVFRGRSAWLMSEVKADSHVGFVKV